MTAHNLTSEQSPTRRPRGRPRDPKLTDEERRAHRRLRPKQNTQIGKPERLVAIALTEVHIRNGERIGPGEVTVPSGVAQEMVYAEEQQALQAHKLQNFWKGDVGYAT